MRRAVRAVERHAASRQVELEDAVKLPEVVADRSFEVADAADRPVAGASGRDGALDLGLGLVRQLPPIGAEQLDAVVGPRIVRSGHHGCEV